MHYHDFILQIGEVSSDGSRYTVHVDSPAGQGEGIFRLPLGPSPGPVWAPRPRAEARNLTSPQAVSAAPLPSPQEAGKQLFEALFTGEVRQLFDQSWGRVESTPEEGLRLQLRFNPRQESSSRLAELPWELLYRPDTQQFLGFSRRTPISRHLAVPQGTQPLVLPVLLRVLGVMANPAGTQPLHLDREREALEDALEGARGVEVEFQRVTTAAGLRRALLHEEYHVVHFMGHGEFAPGRGDGWLLFEDESGRPDQVPGRHLADELRDCPSLRLVLLNACSTGCWTALGGNPFAGVATALVLAGVPAVVAMRAPISNRAAVTFSSELYRHLAHGDPLDAAVAEGRLAVQRQDRESDEWSIPVLFLRQPALAAARSPASEHHREPAGQSPRPGAGGRSVHPEAVSEGKAPGRSGRLIAGGILAVLFAVALAVGLALGPNGWPFGSEEKSPGEPVPSQETSAEEDGQAGPRPTLPAPPPIDVASLQKPPYRDDEVQIYLRLPVSSTVATSTWRAQMERSAGRELSSLGLHLTGATNAAWLVILDFKPPEVAPGGPSDPGNHVCTVRADYKLIHERHQKGQLRTWSETVSQLTAARACEAAVQRFAERVGQDVLAAYLDG